MRCLVLTRNYQQFCDARRMHKETLANATYVSTPQTLYGWSPDTVVYAWGQHYLNPHYSEYMDIIHSRGMKVKYL